MSLAELKAASEEYPPAGPEDLLALNPHYPEVLDSAEGSLGPGQAASGKGGLGGLLGKALRVASFAAPGAKSAALFGLGDMADLVQDRAANLRGMAALLNERARVLVDLASPPEPPK